MTANQKKILDLLKNDARYTASQIADMLCIPVCDVEKTIEEFERDGVIVKYSAIVNDDEFFGDGVQALIEVKVNPMKEKGYDEIAEYVEQFAEVKNLYLMSGAYDLAIFIEGKNLKEVARFVSEKLSCINQVQAVSTHFILKKYKIEGVALDRQKKERLIIQP